MKISLTLFAALAVIAAPVLANDSSFLGIAGSPTLSKNEHKQIRMESEKVVLTLRPNELFDTDARFVFVNDSNRAMMVRMGFPETNYGDGWEGTDGSTSGFKKFATTVNGRVVKAKRTIIDRENNEIWWIKTVSFAPHERKNVRVMATSELGGSTDYTFRRALSYNFTGKNWKGLVSRSDLEVRIPFSGTWAVAGASYTENTNQRMAWTPKVEVKNGVAYLRKSWRNWQAQSAVNVGIRRIMPDWMLAFPNDDLILTNDFFSHITTFRVGRKSDALGPVDAPRPQGFINNGVAMVSFDHLANMAAELGIGKRGYNAATRAAFVEMDGTKLSFAPGNRAMTVLKDGKTQQVALPVPPVLIPVVGEGRALYIPLAAAAGELGLPFKVNLAKHRFWVGK